jgi:hypothetical protein
MAEVKAGQPAFHLSDQIQQTSRSAAQGPSSHEAHFLKQAQGIRTTPASVEADEADKR